MRIYDENGRRLVTAGEGAELAGIKRESFLARVTRKTGPQPVGRVGGVYLFDAEEIAKWASWQPRAGRTKK